MTVHKGSHPRMGAIDVVPFVPVRNVEREEALEIARRYGRWLEVKEFQCTTMKKRLQDLKGKSSINP